MGAVRYDDQQGIVVRDEGGKPGVARAGERIARVPALVLQRQRHAVNVVLRVQNGELSGIQAAVRVGGAGERAVAVDRKRQGVLRLVDGDAPHLCDQRQRRIALVGSLQGEGDRLRQHGGADRIDGERQARVIGAVAADGDLCHRCELFSIDRVNIDAAGEVALCARGVAAVVDQIPASHDDAVVVQQGEDLGGRLVLGHAAPDAIGEDDRGVGRIVRIRGIPRVGGIAGIGTIAQLHRIAHAVAIGIFVGVFSF